jgi:hypothetical protein
MLLSVLALEALGALAASAEIKLPANDELKSMNAHCALQVDLIDDESCYGVFYCSDGGCTPHLFVALIDPSSSNTVAGVLASLPVTEFALCSNFEMGGRATVSFEWRKEWIDALEAGFIPYCGATVPGFENDVVIALRKAKEMVHFASRVGDPAGSPPTFVTIDEDTFHRLRGEGMAQLVGAVSDSIEDIVGGPCVTSERITCSISTGNGRISINLLAPSTGMSGREGFWERSRWEIYPNQLYTDTYAIAIDLPVTSIRRWPKEGSKPQDGFTSLDYDDGFEVLRNHVAQEIAAQIDGRVTYEGE